MEIWGKTHPGMVREVNQDTFFAMQNENETCIVFAVADGLGGHNAGEVASNLCVNELKKFFHNYGDKNFLTLTEKIKEEIHLINDKILKLANEDESLAGMGTTLTMCVVYKNKMSVFHVGDSRCYRIKRGAVKKVTTDHSLVEHMLKNKEITKEEALNHPNRNVITNAVGTSGEMYVDIYHVRINKGELVLVCSDGLTEHIEEKEFEGIIAEGGCVKDAVELLVKEANDRGGSDNITVVLYNAKGEV